jgi:putative methionine-R-sulfoxide reductase with GAF domain
MPQSPEDPQRHPDPLESAFEHLEKIRAASGNADATPVMQSGTDAAAPKARKNKRQDDTASLHTSGQIRDLFRRARQATSILELQSLLSTLLDLFIEMTDSERGFIMLDWQAEKVEVGRDFTVESLKGNRLAMSRTVLQDVARTGTSVFVEDTVTQQAYGSRDSIVALSLRSFYCVPMVHDGRVNGICYTDSRKPGVALPAACMNA